jgi:hypothetical protein
MFGRSVNEIDLAGEVCSVGKKNAAVEKES